MKISIGEFWSWHFLKLFLKSFLEIFGVLALFLGVLSIFFGEKLNFGFKGLISTLSLSLIGGFIMAFPRKKISRCFSEPDMRITIKTGNLFKEDSHLVIGMNDVFDTEIGEIISGNSIQGQFLTERFNGDRAKLDNALEKALREYETDVVIDDSKTKGKKKRYPIGTVAVLDSGKQKYFCSAYSKMQANVVATSSIKEITHSLNKLWKEIRLKAQQEKVAMPIIGSGLAKLRESHNFLIELIIFSFIIASLQKIVTKELVIVVSKDDSKKVSFLKIREFLESI